MDIKTQLYHFLQTIPKGKVVTYKFLAEKFKIHPRYVGKILNQNQLPDIYPCYKVIKSDRTLGGYNGEVEMKVKRLAVDGIHPKEGKIEEKHIRQGE